MYDLTDKREGLDRTGPHPPEQQYIGKLPVLFFVSESQNRAQTF